MPIVLPPLPSSSKIISRPKQVPTISTQLQDIKEELEDELEEEIKRESFNIEPVRPIGPLEVGNGKPNGEFQLMNRMGLDSDADSDSDSDSGIEFETIINNEVGKKLQSLFIIRDEDLSLLPPLPDSPSSEEFNRYNTSSINNDEREGLLISSSSFSSSCVDERQHDPIDILLKIDLHDNEMDADDENKDIGKDVDRSSNLSDALKIPTINNNILMAVNNTIITNEKNSRIQDPDSSTSSRNSIISLPMTTKHSYCYSHGHGKRSSSLSSYFSFTSTRPLSNKSSSETTNDVYDMKDYHTNDHDKISNRKKHTLNIKERFSEFIMNRKLSMKRIVSGSKLTEGNNVDSENQDTSSHVCDSVSPLDKRRNFQFLPYNTTTSTTTTYNNNNNNNNNTNGAFSGKDMDRDYKNHNNILILIDADNIDKDIIEKGEDTAKINRLSFSELQTEKKINKIDAIRNEFEKSGWCSKNDLDDLEKLKTKIGNDYHEIYSNK
ncbi:uncharacterized protein NDAI_0H01230 [Naumovozyma dairenensis CBS 421]|uniref:Uncharacterized protein n=1 Tax=Naumovozyma dairenensis (strain ATCC 10597 / BCRC 20456 / CBS 421 / NBRC 0211 / NRRL Y-12639) TaxID=1071378 RepID=G0WET6_NAUDC|nr:hypothetical protein NDAI_0H01230 [Naumovozyma dairenensis CBS 421]CCD26297.1 hypothetical protein NDAI_0H01230 [Naumovozyma dairenensis CBS 421]